MTLVNEFLPKIYKPFFCSEALIPISKAIKNTMWSGGPGSWDGSADFQRVYNKHTNGHTSGQTNGRMDRRALRHTN